jgi:formylglycine-generating enzyme required for sulfatase activity
MTNHATYSRYSLITTVIILAFCALVSSDASALAAPKIEMVSVSGGCFRMGDTFGDGIPDERPVHEVCVDHFSIGKYEVTRAEWQAVMGNNPSNFIGDRRPVVNVSWDDAQAFIRKLNRQTGKRYRLPTEAEWEYAARSGGKKEKWAGTSDPSQLDSYAWSKENSWLKVHVVGMKRPNGLGIYDMSGNVWEWVQDRYGDVWYEESPKDNPPGTENGQCKGAAGRFLVPRHLEPTRDGPLRERSDVQGRRLRFSSGGSLQVVFSRR